MLKIVLSGCLSSIRLLQGSKISNDHPQSTSVSSFLHHFPSLDQDEAVAKGARESAPASGGKPGSEAVGTWFVPQLHRERGTDC